MIHPKKAVTLLSGGEGTLNHSHEERKRLNEKHSPTAQSVPSEPGADAPHDAIRVNLSTVTTAPGPDGF